MGRGIPILTQFFSSETLHLSGKFLQSTHINYALGWTEKHFFSSKQLNTIHIPCKLFKKIIFLKISHAPKNYVTIWSRDHKNWKWAGFRGRSYNLNVFLLISGYITSFKGVYDQYGYLPPLPQGFSRNLFFYSKFYPKGLIRPIRGYHILPKPIPIDLVDPKPSYSITKTWILDKSEFWKNFKVQI